MQIFKRKASVLLAAASLTVIALSASGTAAAQAAKTYPSKPVTIIMPFPPGGMGDVLARLLANALAEEWKQPVVVENKPGASGMIGNAYVSRATPDGYTLLVAISQTVQAPALYPKLQYDIVKDFTPISKLSGAVSLFAVPSNSEIKSLKDFVTLASRSPGKYTYGTYGAGTSSHIYSEIFNKRNNISTVHVSYKGAAPLLNDMMGGHVALSFSDLSTALPFIQAGKINAFAVTGTKRSPALPNVPTFKELGYSGFDVVGWYGLFGPANMPADLVQKISASTIKVMKSPEMQKKLVTLGQDPIASTPEEFAKDIQSDLATWRSVVAETGIKLDN
jgi:tripartite-type tricarboxylate transporter receptor subunit TctC